MNTENIAHEKRYRDWWAQYDAMFAPENRFPQQDEQFPLMDRYSIRSKAYLYDGDLHLCGSESQLLGNEGKMRYAWRNLDTLLSVSPPQRKALSNLPHRTLWIERSGGGERTGDALCPFLCLPRGGEGSRRSIHLDQRGLWTLARICWLSPAAFGPVPTPLSYWTFPARSSPNPRSVGWICGTSLTRTTPDLTILSLSAETTTACFFGAATQRTTGGKKLECRWNS